jgi:hypothetical protein
MNNNSDGHDPPATPFYVPDVALLTEQSRELLERSKQVVEIANQASRQLQYAITQCDKVLREVPRRTADDDQI